MKIVAARCQILRVKYCTKSFVGWGSAPDPAGKAYSAPHTPRWILGAYFEGEGRDERGRGWPEKGRKGKRGREGQGRGRGGEGAGLTPKLKLGAQNYFSGAGAVESAYWTSY